jgi:2-polyprenyl-3-methyl-5-hydroxy-6-metoxy-1,4-benzoquinol methylase
MEKLNTIFDEKYFEDGVRSRVSAYENYRWMPERTIREASSIINAIPFNNVLDYGCGVSDVGLLLAQNGFDVTLADLELPKLEFAKKRFIWRGLDIKAIGINDTEKLAETDQKFDLIETLAESIADHCLANKLVASVVVKLHKPAAAKSLGIDDVSVVVKK